jgi:quercetin dioxygenase-like cupin family protein
MAILKGKFEITVSDGETRLLGPGDLGLVEDLIGKGHYTKNDSDNGENLVLVTQLSDE